MIILGINISHDASSCIVKDGKVIYFCEEERLAKIKHYEFSQENTKFYGISKLQKYGITKVDRLVFASFRRDYDTKDLNIIEEIKKQLHEANIKVDKVAYNAENHHIYHASNAFFASGFKEAAALVMDGSGAHTNKYIDHKEIESIYKFEPKGITTIYKHYSDNWYIVDNDFRYFKESIPNEALYSNAASCGKLFADWCMTIGLLEGNEAGKYMGLASYGTLTDKDNWIDLIEGNPVFNKTCIDKLKIYRALNINNIKLDLNIDSEEFKICANNAKKVQEETKKYTIHLIKKALEKANTNNIVLSGGYFLNCVNNYEYIKSFPNINFYIDPMAYDGGTALGAALLDYRIINGPTAEIEPIKNLYLGG